MTWIRFGRDEPRAPSILMPSNRGSELDLHRYRQDGPLLLLFAPPGGVRACAGLFEAVKAAALDDQDAEMLVVTGEEADLAAEDRTAVAYDHEGSLCAQYARLIATPSAGKPLLFVLDRDGSPVYAWVGGCMEGDQLATELVRKLQSASFLCPECSVPDPNSAATWDAVY